MAIIRVGYVPSFRSFSAVTPIPADDDFECLSWWSFSSSCSGGGSLGCGRRSSSLRSGGGGGSFWSGSSGLAAR